MPENASELTVKMAFEARRNSLISEAPANVLALISTIRFQSSELHHQHQRVSNK
jgi:hypothetical protein